MIIPATAVLAILTWIFVEIYAQKVWIRITAGLVTIGLSVACALIAMQAYVDYLTGTHVSLLKAFSSDMKQPSSEKIEFWATHLPRIEANRNSISQMHRLFVERDQFLFKTLEKEELEQGAAANP